MLNWRRVAVFAAMAGFFAGTVPGPGHAQIGPLKVAKAESSQATTPPADENTTPAPVTATQAPAATPQPDILSRSAATYATYQLDVTETRDKPFTSQADIDRALTNLGTQNADALTRGWMSYNALIAAQSPEFADKVREARAYFGDETFYTYLRSPNWVRGFDGSDKAMSRALSAVKADTRRIRSAGDIVAERAYSLQGQSWAKKKVTSKPATVQQLQSGKLTGRTIDSDMLAAFSAPDVDVTLGQLGNSSLWEGVTRQSTRLRTPSLGLSGIPLRRPSFRADPMADRILTLAAYRITGATDPGFASDLSMAMTEQRQGVKHCIEGTQLRLTMCVDTNHFIYERPYCIGEHALKEVAGCMAKVSD